MKPQIQIINQTRGKVDVNVMEKTLHKVLKVLKVKQCDWTITFVGDRKMAELHEQTMNLPTTTDVLTFDLRDDAPTPEEDQEGTAVELDTVLCRDEAARRAKELKHAVDEELLLYAIHSLLHVQGYNDLKKKDAARMHVREDEILAKLGMEPVYAKIAPPTRGKK